MRTKVYIMITYYLATKQYNIYYIKLINKNNNNMDNSNNYNYLIKAYYFYYFR